MKDLAMKVLAEGVQVYAAYKPAIYMFLGWALGLVPDYYFGNSKHKSFPGFLKFLYLKNKGAKNVEQPKGQ